MFGDTVLRHEAMFETAKKTVMLVAHVNTLPGLTGDAPCSKTVAGHSQFPSIQVLYVRERGSKSRRCSNISSSR